MHFSVRKFDWLGSEGVKGGNANGNTSLVNELLDDAREASSTYNPARTIETDRLATVA